MSLNRGKGAKARNQNAEMKGRIEAESGIPINRFHLREVRSIPLEEPDASFFYRVNERTLLHLGFTQEDVNRIGAAYTDRYDPHRVPSGVIDYLKGNNVTVTKAQHYHLHPSSAPHHLRGISFDSQGNLSSIMTQAMSLYEAHTNTLLNDVETPLASLRREHLISIMALLTPSPSSYETLESIVSSIGDSSDALTPKAIISFYNRANLLEIQWMSVTPLPSVRAALESEHYLVQKYLEHMDVAPNPLSLQYGAATSVNLDMTSAGDALHALREKFKPSST